MKDCTVNILGTEYKIYHRDEKEDELLDGKYRDGYTDISNHEIIICNKKEECELRDYENYKKAVLRHEILHAFLYECGLDSCSGSSACGWAINEEMIDFFAIQSPKIFKIFQELEVL